MIQHERDETQPESFSRELGKELVQRARSWLRWSLLGAVVGAVVLGGIGLWYFGLTGLWIGAGIGAAGGGLGAFFLYGEPAEPLAGAHCTRQSGRRMLRLV